MTEQLYHPRIPVFKILLQTYCIVKERYKYLIKVSTPFFIIQLLSYIYLGFFDMGLKSHHSLLIIVNFLFSSIVIVAFHQIFIIDMKDIERLEVIRLESREWLFMFWLLIIMAIGKIILTISMLPFIGFLIHGSHENIKFVFLIILPPVFYILSRWVLVLPATSIENKNATLNYAWALSKENGLRLTFLVFSLPTIMYFLYDTSTIINSLISYTLTILAVLISIGTLSVSYSYLQKR